MYLHEVIWPEVALKKLAGDKVQITEEDLHKGFDANYGPRVRVRAIVLNHQRRAQEVWELARKVPPIEKLAKRPAEKTAGGVWAEPSPDVLAVIDDAAKQFGKLAAQYSIEAGSNALEGEVPPIQRFSGRPLLEQEAFSLRAGELSGIVQLADKFVILFCEGRTKPIGAKFEEVRNQIADDIRDKKMRVAMADEFTKIQDAPRSTITWPARRKPRSATNTACSSVPAPRWTSIRPCRPTRVRAPDLAKCRPACVPMLARRRPC